LKSEEVLPRVQEERNNLHTAKQRKTKWLGHMLHRNCLLKCVIEGKIEEIGRQVRRHTQLLRRHWKLKKEALDHTLWRNCFGRGYGSVIRQAMWWW
jgi:hypothetical protein